MFGGFVRLPRGKHSSLVCERKYDIIFLQETHSTAEVEDIWKTQWRGKLHFAHGSKVMILVRRDLDLDLKPVKCDNEGRWIIMEGEVQGSLFSFVNIYAPNKIQEQCSFFDILNKDIEDCVVNSEGHRIILGGDLNVTFEPDLDCSGGKPFKKESVNHIQDLCLDIDLVDIWRIRNPESKRFTWRQRNPFIFRRLDYWLISDACQDDIERCCIIPSINSDHSEIYLHFNTIDKPKHGPSFWKFNASLTEDDDFI